MSRPLGSFFTDGLKSEHQPSGYPQNWNKISAAFRKTCSYTCMICTVCCESHQHMVDAHHINGDKNNCDYANLQCLCKYCHSKQDFHSHYKIKSNELKTLRRLWEEQRISSPEHK